MKIAICGLVVSAAAVSGGFFAAQAQQPPPQSPNMTFFVTGVGPGKGGDLGGIEGADRYCQELAQRAGAGNKTWRAYLSTQATEGKPASNARDRIGHGPWQNFKGEIVAQNIDDRAPHVSLLCLYSQRKSICAIARRRPFRASRHSFRSAFLEWRYSLL
jgi:hypothetical protein